jgi:alkyl hydroperoxide reductase subunit AhpC
VHQRYSADHGESGSGVKIIGLSVDPVDQHRDWADDIKETQGAAPNYPVIGDSDFAVSKLYGMLPASTSGDPAQRTPADNQTVRNVFVVGPDRRIKLILVYPMTTGRNFDEVLRVIDSLQLTAQHKVATPGELGPGRGRHHRRLGLQRRGQGALRRMAGAQALHPHRSATRLIAGQPARPPARWTP